MKNEDSLVSIMIPNRNHAAYVGQAIESALNQTYKNIEIIVNDNCSDDNSIEVISSYLSRGVRLCRNPENIAIRTLDVLIHLAEGDFLLILPADDLIKPSLVEKCLKILEEHPNVGFVHSDRDLINSHGDITYLDPFFKCSFIAPGAASAPIFMVAEVAQAAQCVMRRSAFLAAGGFETEINHLNIDRELWFRMSLESDYAYIRENLAQIRIHEVRETSVAIRNFFHPLAIYLTLKHQHRLGGIHYGLSNVIEKMPQAERKLSNELIQIAVSLIDEDRSLAEKYLKFAELVYADIITDELYVRTKKACQNKNMLKTDLEDNRFIYRKRGYEPPSNFKMVEV